MNLHCSQTFSQIRLPFLSFDIPMNLHCSQTPYCRATMKNSLIFLWIYTALKPHGIGSGGGSGLIFLWIYTALKQLNKLYDASLRLIFLWIYTALKQTTFPCLRDSCLIFLWIYTALKQLNKLYDASLVWYSYEFTLLSNPRVKLSVGN